MICPNRPIPVAHREEPCSARTCPLRSRAGSANPRDSTFPVREHMSSAEKQRGLAVCAYQLVTWHRGMSCASAHVPRWARSAARGRRLLRSEVRASDQPRSAHEWKWRVGVTEREAGDGATEDVGVVDVARLWIEWGLCGVMCRVRARPRVERGAGRRVPVGDATGAAGCRAARRRAVTARVPSTGMCVCSFLARL